MRRGAVLALVPDRFRLVVHERVGGRWSLLVDKITTVPRSKLGEHVGRLRDEEMVRLGRAILVLFGVVRFRRGVANADYGSTRVAPARDGRRGRPRRDRPGATRVFTERVRATVTAGRLDPPVTIVLEGRARAGADEADVDGVEVVHAPGEGDDTISAIAETSHDVLVVTADREPAARVRAANAAVVGPSGRIHPGRGGTPRVSGRCDAPRTTTLPAAPRRTVRYLGRPRGSGPCAPDMMGGRLCRAMP